MSSRRKETVEFYGGPIDGQVSQFVEPLKPFVIVQTVANARHVSVFVQLFRMLFFYEHTEPPVLAVYELQDRRYTYLRSTLASETTINPRRVCELVQNRPRFAPCSPSFPNE